MTSRSWLEKQTWLTAALCLALAAPPASGEGITTATVSADFDGDGVGDLWVVDPTGAGRLLMTEGGVLRERTREIDAGAGLGVAQPPAPAAAVPMKLQPIPLTVCGKTIKDRGALGGCLRADSVPKLGRLYPLSQSLYVDPSGDIGIGTLTPADKLSVEGAIESLDGGLRFPDGTLQTTATLPGPPGATGPQGPTGPTGPAGPPGQNGITALNGQFGPALTIAAAGAASVSTSGSTVTVSAPSTVCTFANKTYSAAAVCYTAGNEIPCSFGFRSLRLSCNADGSWQVISSSQCFNPSAGPVCGF